jgi:hypothetical protein
MFSLQNESGFGGVLRLAAGNCSKIANELEKTRIWAKILVAKAGEKVYNFCFWLLEKYYICIRIINN